MAGSERPVSGDAATGGPASQQQQNSPSSAQGMRTDGSGAQWYNEQERNQQLSEPAGGASTSHGGLEPATAAARKPRRHVGFAAEIDEPAKPTPEPVTAAGGSAADASVHSEDSTAGAGQSSGTGAAPDAPVLSRTGSFIDFFRFTKGAGEAGNITRTTSVGNLSRTQSLTGSQTGELQASGKSEGDLSRAGSLGASFTGMLHKMLGRPAAASTEEAGAEVAAQWFTGVDDFKPICHQLHRGRYHVAYFACAKTNGVHYLLKKYDKHKMTPSQERGVRRAIILMEHLEHPNIVRCLGHWEDGDQIYMVEEYAGKGDILNDAIGHPERYTERHVATKIVGPLLRGLSYLHANNIMHRSIMPEHLHMAIDDNIKISHFLDALDKSSQRPQDRVGLLDYMAPEMLSVLETADAELSALAEGGSAAGGAGPRQEGSDSEDERSKDGGGFKLWRPQHAPTSADGANSPSPRGSPMLGFGLRRRGDVSKSSSYQAAWERMDCYDEKVDIWQVGCLTHELLCGSMAFELEDLLQTGGLILWADLDVPPAPLAPDCLDFVRQALTKDPARRPTADELQQHPWLLRCVRGEPYRDMDAATEHQGGLLDAIFDAMGWAATLKWLRGGVAHGPHHKVHPAKDASGAGGADQAAGKDSKEGGKDQQQAELDLAAAKAALTSEDREVAVTAAVMITPRQPQPQQLAPHPPGSPRPMSPGIGSQRLASPSAAQQRPKSPAVLGRPSEGDDD